MMEENYLMKTTILDLYVAFDIQKLWIIFLSLYVCFKYILGNDFLYCRYSST